MSTAKQNLGIPETNKIIISLDGGGMRGILTLQLLKKLEEVAGAPCHQWCDMLAGTSTGAIIAGLILKRKSAVEIENLYMQLVSQVFTKRNFFSDRFLNPPKFDKKNYRSLLQQIVGDVTLHQACQDQRPLDILITSKDMAAGEETFFTCFNKGGDMVGTYKDILLRAAMEATMSAPTYFLPLERFIDGGTTTFNNPVGAAVLEALCYDGKEKYKTDALTVFSFGTGTSLRFIKPEDTRDPKGLDLKFWLNYVMDETGKDASEMQTDMLRSKLLNNNFDFRRYQISLDETSLHKIPDKDITQVYSTQANSLRQLKNDELAAIDMADVSKFGLMKVIGEAMAEYICPPTEKGKTADQQKGNWFKKDLVIPNTTRDQLVTTFGDVNEIQRHLISTDWINNQPTA